MNGSDRILGLVKDVLGILELSAGVCINLLRFLVIPGNLSF